MVMSAHAQEGTRHGVAPRVRRNCSETLATTKPATMATATMTTSAEVSWYREVATSTIPSLRPLRGAVDVTGTTTDMAKVHVKLTLDLHDIYDDGPAIDRALRGVMDEAVRTKAKVVEIVPGKGSGQLRKRVLRFLDQKDVRMLYHRVEKDQHNHGHVLVHFRWR